MCQYSHLRADLSFWSPSPSKISTGLSRPRRLGSERGARALSNSRSHTKYLNCSRFRQLNRAMMGFSNPISSVIPFVDQVHLPKTQWLCKVAIILCHWPQPNYVGNQSQCCGYRPSWDFLSAAVILRIIALGILRLCVEVSAVITPLQASASFPLHGRAPQSQLSAIGTMVVGPATQRSTESRR